MISQTFTRIRKQNVMLRHFLYFGLSSLLLLIMLLTILLPFDLAHAQSAEPVLALSPTSVDFGDQPLQTQSDAQQIVVSNAGAGSLTIADIDEWTGFIGDFLVDNDCLGAVLGAGETCAIDVRAFPFQLGPVSVTMQVRVDDGTPAGQSAFFTLQAVGVDNLAPSITSSSAVSVTENQTSAIDVQATDDNDSEGSGLTFSLSGGVDDVLFNIDSGAGVVTFITAPDFENPADTGADNNYDIQVTVTDAGGLTDVQDITITVTDVAEDTTPPAASPTQSPAANAAGWNNGDVTVTWNWADEAGGSGVDPNNCTDSSTSSGEGIIDLMATCADLAGNVGNASYTVQVDKTAPDTIITAVPAAHFPSADATFEFSGSDATSGVAGFECQLDGGGFSPCTSPQSYTGLANGSHTFEVRAIDVADNVDASPSSHTWTVDAPITCEPGSYLADPGDTTCTPADPGYFVPHAGATEQTPCAPGSYSAVAGAVSCTLADPGYFVSDEASTGQTVCEPGSYSDVQGATSCTLAEPGSFVPAAGSTGQTACEPGSYSDTSGATACTLADIGFYVDISGATAQTQCPAGTTTEQEGSTDISDCIPVSAPITTCGGYDIFADVPGEYSAPGFSGNLIVGTDDNDWLIGSNDADLILGLEGSDYIYGRKGDDVICGGSDVDIVLGMRGNDALYGDEHADLLTGGPGNDALYGGDGWDYLIGSGGQDTLHGEDGLDVLLGGASDDDLFGGDGADKLYGNRGNDDLNGGDGYDFCRGGPGRDAIDECEGASITSARPTR